MPLLGYKKQFTDLVKSLEKRQSVRALRKRPFKTGDRLYHYFGLRTKACRKLLENDCKSVHDIVVEPGGDVIVDGEVINFAHKLEAFAVADGFRADDSGSAYEHFMRFFKKNHKLPLYGQLIKW